MRASKRVLLCPVCGKSMEQMFIRGDGGGLTITGGPARHHNHYHCRCEECDAEYIAEGKPARLRMLDSADTKATK